MKRLAFIVQRYGLEVNGGAEYHCRILVEKLRLTYDIEVLTSCAKDYVSWKNEYPEGLSLLNEIKVRRFKTAQERNKVKAHRLGRKLRKRSLSLRLLHLMGIQSAYEKAFHSDRNTEEDSFQWSKEQGPYTPGLMEFLKQNHGDYDALVFFTYLYYPTTYGLRVAPEKSILIPTAHDEPPIYMPAFQSFFKLPKAILFNTRAEQKFVNNLFHNEDIYSDIVGVGIDRLDREKPSALEAVLKPGCSYLIYIGRIDRAKGCDLMIRYFLKYKKTRINEVKLVLVGQSFMNIPESGDIIKMGFVQEDVKNHLLKSARALLIPSFYESLSLVTLEGMIEGVPVLANKQCEVLKDHIEKSNAGFLFDDFQSFERSVDAVVSPNANLNAIKENGRKYVEEKYDWTVVLSKFKKAVDFVSP